MFRLTRKVFHDLSIWMVGLGLIIGIIFPFFVSWMGIPSEYVFKPWFFVVCIAAGLIVGGVNILLARSVVGTRLRILADRMQHVTQRFLQIKQGMNISECNAEECLVVVDSEDELGLSARSYNALVKTLFESLETEDSIERFNQLLGTQLEVKDLTERALIQLMSHTGSAAGAVLIEKEGALEVASSQGIQEVQSLLSNDHLKSVLRNENRLILTLPENIRVDGVLAKFQPREVIIEPILFKNVMLGLLVLGSANSFSLDALKRLGLFSQNLAMALHNALLFDRLERLAALDSLTGIYNRRFGLTRLHEEFGRTLRMKVPLGLMMFDLDHFKNVNDVYGHLTGDRVLLRLANVAKSVMREGDILVRYGGEEFLAILPGASRKDVSEIADRLRRKIAESGVTHGEDVIKVTVSVGGVSYPEKDAENEIELVDHADKALYAAKDSGRNCVVMAGVN